jgi:hypothetical protein
MCSLATPSAAINNDLARSTCRAGGDRVARDRVGLTEEAKKRFAILGDCSTPAKPEHASGWWMPAAWHRVAAGDV